ncbi:DNA-binding protein [Palleronia sp. LCG004]|uniref:DNA-binding protein n=1 Tax=Palleronia sp. LCG004 TaxID=3079304 RepID=UPI0029433CEA|nr:DNA-binding protein [Palleronia sp. LCG004]WOI56077.1 DNA-binding protein [Palleronia sp. LCG004]
MAEASSTQRGKATREAVFAAANQLDADGTPPTVEKVGKITGGSFSTITKHLRAWREERAAKAELMTAVPDMPAEMTALWAQLWRLAEAEHQERRDAWHHIRRALEVEISERDKEIARLEALTAENHATIEQLTERAKAAEARTVSFGGLGYVTWPAVNAGGPELPWTLFDGVEIAADLHVRSDAVSEALPEESASETAQEAQAIDD